MISDVYFPRINGVSTSIETFRADLAAENVEVQLIAPEYPETHAKSASSPVTWRVPSRRIPFDPEDRLMRWRPLKRLARRLAHGGVDLIHVQTPFAAHYAGTGVARQYRVPVVATYHTHFEEYIAHYLPGLPRSLLKAAARRLATGQCNDLNAVVVPSRAMRDTLADYGVRAPMHVLPTGIPVDHFDSGNRSRFRARHDIPEHRPVALFVGRVAFEKNIGFLLEAMESALELQPDLLLVIAGEGPALPALRRDAAARGLGDKVRFVGYLDRTRDLPDCYAAADVFVFASRTETQGLVLLEAMAAGVPVYALAEMGTCDILDPQRGAVIAPDDPAGFGRGLGALISNRYRLETLAADARDYAREWAAPSRANQLAGLYRTLVQQA
jgi:glycosyltransferase involved in cell wall biosynthesis